MTRANLRLFALVLITAFSLVVDVRAANVNFETYKSPLVLLLPIEWTGLDFSSRKEREKFTALSRYERQTFLRDVEISPRGQAYFHGVMETFAFFLFTNSARTPEIEQQYSDFRQCAVTQRNDRWYISSWFTSNPPHRTLAFELITLGFAFGCDAFGGDGDGRWIPLDLGIQLEWRDYNQVQRKFYIAAYIETMIESISVFQQNGKIPQSDRAELLIQCITNAGFEKILEKLEGIEVDTKLPLPWTISKAVESVCEG